MLPAELEPEEEDDPEPEYAAWGGDDGYRRHPLRRLAIQVLAVVVIIGFLLAFPLGYLLTAQLQNGHFAAVVAITELVIVVVLLAVVRLSRRRP